MAQWSSTSADDVIETNAPGFESGENQFEFDVRVAVIDLFLEEFLHGL